MRAKTLRELKIISAQPVGVGVGASVAPAAFFAVKTAARVLAVRSDASSELGSGWRLVAEALPLSDISHSNSRLLKQPESCF